MVFVIGGICRVSEGRHPTKQCTNVSTTKQKLIIIDVRRYKIRRRREPKSMKVLQKYPTHSKSKTAIVQKRIPINSVDVNRS